MMIESKSICNPPLAHERKTYGVRVAKILIGVLAQNGERFALQLRVSIKYQNIIALLHLL